MTELKSSNIRQLIYISTATVEVNLTKSNKHTIHGHLSCKTEFGITSVYTDMVIHRLSAGGKHIRSQKQYCMFLLQTAHCWYVFSLITNSYIFCAGEMSEMSATMDVDAIFPVTLRCGRDADVRITLIPPIRTPTGIHSWNKKLEYLMCLTDSMFLHACPVPASLGKASQLSVSAHHISVITVAGICNSVGGGVFWHATAVPVSVANIGRYQG